MHALDLRQKILFSSTQDQSEDTLVYENDHIQKLFLRTVETGLQDENVRLRVRGYLRNPTISDEEVILQVNNAVSTENERVRKLRNQNRPKSAQVAEKAESQDKILKTLEALKVEVAQVKGRKGWKKCE
jgi:CRISPR/Cas system CSM-associated protein Csm2 small subunit